MSFRSMVRRKALWRWKIPTLCAIFLLLSLFPSAAASRAASSAVSSSRRATILWDTWGVPHIFAANDEDLFYAFGRAQMQNHADLLLTLYGEARGRAAEYWGANYLSSDEFVRTMNFPAQARQWLDAQTPAFRRYIQAFTAGMNDYANEHPEEISPQLKVVLPIQPTDVFAHAERVLAEFLLSDCGGVISAGSTQGSGSNGWAIGSRDSANGEAMLLANPHLPWGNEFTFFESQLVSPDMDAYGATLVGFPVLAIAFNQFLSWTHTVNPNDTCDSYQLTLSGNGYLFDGQVRQFETQTQTLLVKQADGILQQQQLVVQRAVQGPVFTARGPQGTEAFAIRIVGVEQFPVYGIWQEWWDMARARNLNQFQNALQRLQIPTFNVIYADRNGHVMYLFNGEVPRRPSGDVAFWAGPVPGDTSTLVWNSLLKYNDLPKVIDPPAGWVQNSNSPPWVTTFPQVFNPQNYPAYLAPQDMSFREQQGVHMLMADEPMSFTQLIADKFSSHMQEADRLLEPLIAAAHQYGDSAALQATDVLQAWDRSANADSKGAVLFELWLKEMSRTNVQVFSVPWNPAHPLTTPSGLADPQGAVNALSLAANALSGASIPLDVPWGTIYRLQRGNIDLPASGGFGDEGSFRVLGYERSATKGEFAADFGDSYIAAVEFSNPVRARVLLVYGNASQPDSPHNGDQLTLYAQNQMRDAWLTLPDIRPHLASSTIIGLGDNIAA